jgi:hypothetical protein
MNQEGGGKTISSCDLVYLFFKLKVSVKDLKRASALNFGVGNCGGP